MKNLTIALLLALGTILSIGYARLRASCAESAEIHARELHSLRARVEELSSRPAAIAVEPPLPTPAPAESTPPGSAASEPHVAAWPREPEATPQPFPGTNAWKAQEAVTDIRKHVAIDPSQTALLAARFKASFENSGGALNGAQFLAERSRITEEVLGSELTNELKRRELEELSREFDERIGNETVVLSRKLGLNPEQEALLKDALAGAERSLAVDRQRANGKMREMMGLHFAGKEGQEELQQGYDELRTLNRGIKERRDAAILDSLGNLLTDEQRNRLLEHQSTRTGE